MASICSFEWVASLDYHSCSRLVVSFSPWQLFSPLSNLKSHFPLVVAISSLTPLLLLIFLLREEA